MKPNLRAWLLSTSMSLLTGCSMTPPKTFTFQADVPENFTVTGTANYKPAPGETCIAPSGEAFTTGSLFFKPEQPKTAHQVEFKVPLTDDDHGCSMVLRGLKLTIEGQWGPRELDMGQEVESAEGSFTPRLLTEPYVTVSRHTALDHTFDARSKYQCANSSGFSLRTRRSRCSA